jgi:hypothetical protein
MKRTFRASCHCGGVRFECDLDLAAGTTRCNCRFCTKARFWMALVKAEDFRLLSGGELLTDYQHTPPSKPEPFLHLCFCSRCGVRGFTKGGILPSLGGPFYAVNVACFDDASDAEWAQAPIHFADGRHNDWSAAPAEHGYL